VNNLVNFSREATTRPGPHAGAPFLAVPASHSHAVQFYDDEEFLFDTVAQFLHVGLLAGEHLLVIATAEHREGFKRHLQSADIDGVLASGRLAFLDARETLAKFMVDGTPDPARFHGLLDTVLGPMSRTGQERAGIRAYGEMVDLLWKDGNPAAAIRLEELWNDAARSYSFSLLCAYLMGNFYKEADTGRFLEVCRNHSHVVPTESYALLDHPEARLREISTLQQRARSLESEIQHRKDVEAALRDALRERNRAENELKACIIREREARAAAEASDAFKEIFLGTLGHDLRNPLNTVLTTARLMTIRGELAPESQRRLERVLASGERMERMIAQILDVTRARLTGGTLVSRKHEQDLVPLVSKIVEEIRVAHPDQVIDFVTSGPCVASVDGDRFEQVVSNLLGNAVTHGDPSKPVRVAVEERSGMVHLLVHNRGKPIEPGSMSSLFDPFTRRQRPERRSDGLGLGLYISQRIVVAHGGDIEVESTEETGTRFLVSLPQDGHEGADGPA
jgi:signal transduction histidine kinase